MSAPSFYDRLLSARLRTAQHLIQRSSADGGWRGELSSSALSTAVAALAWICSPEEGHHSSAEKAVDWLATNGNSDGGWGDTPQSLSNPATTLLVWSSLFAYNRRNASAPSDSESARRSHRLRRESEECARVWLCERFGSTEPAAIAGKLLLLYGNDQSFSVPILTHCALAGTLGKDPWQFVPQLPLELAALPHDFFRLIRLPVVSYAMPALIAIGLVRHAGSGSNGLRGHLRSLLTPLLLRKLEKLQPESGGYLEAAPLTGFVVMALLAAGHVTERIVCNGLLFLSRSQRSDGSLPIDSDLCLWLTSHASRALAGELPESRRQELSVWLLARQQTRVHPYTHSAPGGWAWTDLSGGVPDADDTAGALLALDALEPALPQMPEAAGKAVQWLLNIQNRNGGFPTFCRGWGALPFDRSCPDITAHALQALTVWKGKCPALTARISTSIQRALRYLALTQNSDGSWFPLWFGNQHTRHRHNPVFGTAQVCLALHGIPSPALSACKKLHPESLSQRGQAFLLTQQNSDGGWGGELGTPSSAEETALALAAVSLMAPRSRVQQATEWLLAATKGGTAFPTAAIGLYFSSLWYEESLYPVIFSLRAFQAVSQRPDNDGAAT